MFQSTHPHGVRPETFALPEQHAKFQSTHPHGVRRILPLRHYPKTMFQSTHPHGVRRELYTQQFHTIEVSIHAPTRGATYIMIFTALANGFQSTHPHGVRHVSAPAYAEAYSFQSTHPHGVRLTRFFYAWKGYCVSIHAPTRGATLVRSSKREVQ